VAGNCYTVPLSRISVSSAISCS